MKNKFKGLRSNPPAVLAIGFASLILLGGVLLNLPIASKTGESIGFINAVFTASSSLCVTGLTVVNTAEYWSTFGHVVIISLIQIGGLGFMTMAAIVALILGKKITLTERLILKEQLNQETLTGLVRLTKNVIFFTFAVEGIGALLLSTRFIPEFGLKKGIWFSIFHAISGFCNAGFDIIGDSIVPYSSDIVINLTICMLIIFGGVGFFVFKDWYTKRSFSRITLHSKMVTIVTIALLLIGTLVFFGIEYTNIETIGNMRFGEKVLTSFFQSTVTRTAGFYSVDMVAIKDTSAFLFIILMFIGGSPGSTAGGIKTTTIGAIVSSTIATIKGEKDVVIFKKRVSDILIKKSLAIIFISLTLIVIVSFVLTLTEDAMFIDLLFETTSAFATVGLTRGVTPGLTNIGKIIIATSMYIGRVGPLTMAFAFGHKTQHSTLRYSEGYIMIG